MSVVDDMDGEERQPLPNRAYVSLTEAATWIIEDDSRDDDFLIEQDKRLGPSRRRQWKCPSGEPNWLLPHLNLLRQGREPDSDEPKSHDPNIWRGTFADAKRWLAGVGRDAESAYTEVLAIVAKLRDTEDRYTRFYELLRDQCSDGRIILLGIEHHGSSSAGVHIPIPTTFFLRPIFHWRGSGNHDKGELGPDSFGASFEDLLRKSDARPYYLEVCIKRDDVLTLKRLFHGHAVSTSARERPDSLGSQPPRQPGGRCAILFSEKTRWNFAEALAWLCVRDATWLDRYSTELQSPQVSVLDVVQITVVAEHERRQLQMMYETAKAILEDRFGPNWENRDYQRDDMLAHWPESDQKTDRTLGRKPVQRKSATEALNELYPDGPPSDLKEAALLVEVNEYLQGKGRGRVSADTLTRARRAAK